MNRPAGLADQVVVGRGVQRQPAAHELRVLPHRAQPAAAEGRAFGAGEKRRGRAAEQLPGGRPVHQPDRRFQRAGPVRAVAVGAGEEPAVEVLGEQRRSTSPRRVSAQACARVTRCRCRLGSHRYLMSPDQAAVAVVERSCRRRAAPRCRSSDRGSSAAASRGRRAAARTRRASLRRGGRPPRRISRGPPPPRAGSTAAARGAKRGRAGTRAGRSAARAPPSPARAAARGAPLGRRHAAQAVQPPAQFARVSRGDRSGARFPGSEASTGACRDGV